MEVIFMKFNNIIYERRKKLGLTQEELSILVGVSNKTVSHWETGRSQPELSQIPKICNALNIDANELLNVEGSKKEIKVKSKDTLKNNFKVLNIIAILLILISFIFLIGYKINFNNNKCIYYIAGLISSIPLNITSLVLYLISYKINIDQVKQFTKKDKIKYIIYNLIYLLITYIFLSEILVQFRHEHYKNTYGELFNLSLSLIFVSILILFKKKLNLKNKSKLNLLVIIMFALLFLIIILKGNAYIALYLDYILLYIQYIATITYMSTFLLIKEKH